jgi:membrane associated rhomboid family serine protease
MTLSINLVVIAITVLVSIGAFGDPGLKQRLLLYPYAMGDRREWYRLFTSGFIHADWVHLAMNMIVLYYFGEHVEDWFVDMSSSLGRLCYVLFYLVAIGVANIYSVIKNRNNPGYGSLGASGAVAAVLFASIICLPGMKLRFIFLPIPIPGYIFGVLYVIYSMVMARHGRDQINHEAHLYGAVFGFVVASLIAPDLFIAFLDYFANLI